MHREQRISVVAFRCIAQRRRVRAFQRRRRRHQLLTQIRQRQAQWQATVLRRSTQRRGAGLTIAHQARTFGGVVQPPAEDRRPIRAPQRQPRTTQRLLGGGRVKINLQYFRRPGLKAVLTDDLLRVLAQGRQPRALRRLGITGQAQHQGIQRALGGLIALLGRLTGDRLAHLIKAFDGFGMTGEADQR
ncbi:hypothetical protein D3C85_1366240 [compost metagenome]